MTTSGDLLFQDEIRERVRDAYRAIPAGAGRAIAERLYGPEELASVPEVAITWALGVGNPVRHAALSEGETVLDIGCGGGIDSVLAAHSVGSNGRVIGLDLLPGMRARAQAAAEEAGTAAWSEFETGEMEAIPLPDASVDVVISNGVLNLSPRKSRVLAEVARVLVPGGRMCVADLVVERDLPPEVLGSDAAWAGCIAGAISERVLAKKLARAGLEDAALSNREPFSLDDVALYPLFPAELIALMRRLLPADRQRQVATSVIIEATTRSGGRRPRDRGEAGVAERPARPPHPDGAARIGVPTGTARLEDLPIHAIEAAGVTVRNLKQVDDIELKVLDVAPGHSTPYHTHPHAHEGVIVSGAGRLRLEGRDDPLRPGDVFSVNPTDPHAIACDGPEPLRLVCMDCFVE